MRFVLTFNMDNAAFDDDRPGETARILDRVAIAVSNGHRGGPVRDINGNTIGHWKVTT